MLVRKKKPPHPQLKLKYKIGQYRNETTTTTTHTHWHTDTTNLNSCCCCNCQAQRAASSEMARNCKQNTFVHKRDNFWHARRCNTLQSLACFWGASSLWHNLFLHIHIFNVCTLKTTNHGSNNNNKSNNYNNNNGYAAYLHWPTIRKCCGSIVTVNCELWCNCPKTPRTYQRGSSSPNSGREIHIII